MSDYRSRIRYEALKLRRKCDSESAADEITTLRQQLAESEARVAELRASCVNLSSGLIAAAETEGPIKAIILRKQAEAVEEAVVYALRTVGNVDPFEVDIHRFANDYAQRLRNQADEAERAGGEK